MPDAGHAQGWVGWVRPQGGAWRPAVRAATEKECWRLLAAVREPGNCEKLVARAGRGPKGGVE